MELILSMFLNTIKMIESSNCQNTAHKIVQTGIHKGSAAVGCYGIMPNTHKELLKRFPELKHKMVYVKGKNSTEANQELLARYLAKLLYKRTNGNLKSMAAGWFYGHNLPKERLIQYSNTEYVSKFIKYHNLRNVASN